MADPGQADALNKQSLDLASEGRAEDALAANADAVDIYRELAATQAQRLSASTGAWQQPAQTHTPLGWRSR